MTDRDLQTCRAWCRANGVNLIRFLSTPGFFCFDRTPGYLGCIGFHRTEEECYKRVWEALAPIIQSVRNLDAVEVEGPYEPDYYDDDDWRLHTNNGEYLTDLRKQKMSEQTARTIAAILNRECGE